MKDSSAKTVGDFVHATGPNRARQRSRAQLLEDTIDEILEIEARLVEALDGAVLQGVPNLTNNRRNAVWGYNVRAVDKRRRLSFPKRLEEFHDALILTHRGQFNVVTLSIDDDRGPFTRGEGSTLLVRPDQLRVRIRAAGREDFHPEDLPLVLHTVAEAGDTNLFQFEKGGATSVDDHLRQLCDSVRDSMRQLKYKR